jgi:hypothetical protein
MLLIPAHPYLYIICGRSCLWNHEGLFWRQQPQPALSHRGLHRYTVTMCAHHKNSHCQQRLVVESLDMLPVQQMTCGRV